jgi:polysaccharide export outer membrane protein
MWKNQKLSFLEKNSVFTRYKPVYLHGLAPIVLIVVMVLATSCGNLKQLQYLQGPIDTVALGKINFIEPVIQEGDVLGITVYSDNQLASSFFNQGSASPSPGASGALGTSGGVPGASGYEVNEDGNIQLFNLGLVRVEGMTRKQLGDYLKNQYAEKNLLTNPYVDVKFLNYRVVIVGDVNRPGVYTFPSEKVNIFEAIGFAGDLTNFAKRDNILVIREVNNVRRFARLDLTDPNVFNSPFYYLQQNDMVVVDPTKAKAVVNDQSYRTISIATSAVSLIAILISIFR